MDVEKLKFTASDLELLDTIVCQIWYKSYSRAFALAQWLGKIVDETVDGHGFPVSILWNDGALSKLRPDRISAILVMDEESAALRHMRLGAFLINAVYLDAYVEAIHKGRWWVVSEGIAHLMDKPQEPESFHKAPKYFNVGMSFG